MSPTARTLTVAVLGAGGTIAPALVRDLAESRGGGDDAPARPRPASAPRPSAAAHGLGKAEAVALDARSGDWPRRSRAATCSSTARATGVNLDAMRACLKAGCHYLDLGGLYWMTGKQLELNDEFEQRRACSPCSASDRARARPT